MPAGEGGSFFRALDCPLNPKNSACARGHAARARYAAAVQVWVDDASARNYLCCL